MSKRSWIVLDLVVHSAWSISDERDPELAQAWTRLRDALSVAPHQLVSSSNSGQQALIYAISTDLDGLLETARKHAPTEGVASFVAKVWNADPRHSDQPPQKIRLLVPHAPWPKPGYGDDLVAVLAQSQKSEAPMRPEPDFPRLVAQYSASVHKLEFEMMASSAPLAREHVRALAHGTLLSVRALRRAAPSEFTPLVEQAESALGRVWDALK